MTPTESRCARWIEKVLPRIKKHLKQKDLQEAQNILEALKTSTGKAPLRRSRRGRMMGKSKPVHLPHSCSIFHIDPQTAEKIEDELDRGRKIQAIKILREAYFLAHKEHLGLLDAKLAVEDQTNWRAFVAS